MFNEDIIAMETYIHFYEYVFYTFQHQYRTPKSEVFHSSPRKMSANNQEGKSFTNGTFNAQGTKIIFNNL